MEVMGIKFGDNNRIYYYSFGELALKKGLNVLCNTEHGLQFGTIVTDMIDVDEKKISYNIDNIVRIASKEDEVKDKKNCEDALIALEKCRSIAKKNGLEMSVVSARYTFNREQLLFFFLADSRVDFRDLARELASVYKTRIELRQIGVRDKAGNVGGLGICGGQLCCARFLKDFDSVSINMAKNQGIALNPTKINGSCGRLLCCLKYEDETYKEQKKGMPLVGKTVETEKGVGKVVSVDILTRTYKVDVNNNIIEVKL